MEAKVLVDSTNVRALLNALSGKQVHQAITGALRSSAKVLADATEREYTTHTNLRSHKSTITRKSGKQKTKYRRIATVKINTKESSAMVHIMDDFRAKFFEAGTKPRYTKGHKVTGYHTLSPNSTRLYKTRTGKGGYRGSMKAGHYFQKAQEMQEQRIFANMDNELTKSLARIAKRYNVKVFQK